nr:hypothetical protein [Tanacetum cinerariifolium]
MVLRPLDLTKQKWNAITVIKGGHFVRECMAPREKRNRESVRRNVTVDRTYAKALVAQDGIGKDENETKSKTKQRKPSFAKVEFVKPNEQVKSPRESVKQEEHNRQAKHPRKNSQSPRGMSNPHPKRNFVPRAVLMRSGFKTLNTARQNSSRVVVSVNTARQINTAYPRPIVNNARPVLNVFNKAHSHDRIPLNKFTTNKDNNFNEKVNTIRGNITTAGPRARVSDNQGNQGNLQLELQEKEVIDSGCSRHMTGNVSYLSKCEEIDGGYVAFRVDPKGHKITSKDTECVVLSPDFKLLDESQVLLGVPRKNNMYSVECCFFRRVLVIKPHNKTLYELFLGKKHSLSFMRSFGCPVTILNTIDHLGNQSNGSAGKARVETVPDKDYILLPLWTLDLLFSFSSKDSPGNGFKPSGEKEKNDTEGPGNKESEAPITEKPRVNQEKDSVNSTNRVNAVSSTVNDASNEVNVIARKSSIKLPSDLNMPDLEDIIIFEDSNEDVFGTEADLNNMETTFQTASTPMETSKPLMKVENAEDVDVHLYRSMIGSLMYLTFSRPDIMFVVCACARFQVTPKVSHLYVVKRIFRYLKGQPKVSHLYPKDSPFDLEDYTDSDYVGARLDRKSTTGCCHFLESRFISWQCKKQTVVGNSNTEAEFTWVFFLSTKDETSGILKSFITRIENVVDHMVKVIRCDNGPKLKNRDMNQFCEMTEAVSTACYVQNKVLVVKPHNKTSYALFHGRTPMSRFMRPFGCPVTILKTIDHLARTLQQNEVAERRNRTLIEAARTMLADSKLPITFWAEAVSTACYVQNKVLVVKPHNKTSYELFHGRTPMSRFMRPFGCPVTILKTIDHLGTKDNNNASQARQEKSSQDVGFKPSNDVGKKVNEVPRQENECKDQGEKDSVNNTNRVNAVSSTVNVASNEVNAVGRKLSIELPDDPNMPKLKDISIFKD